MRKFMKFCFILAMVLIIVGGALYMMGRKDGGRGDMDELLSEFGGGRVSFDWEDGFGFFGHSSGVTSIVDSVDMGFDPDDASIFDSSHTIWEGTFDKQMIWQGNITELTLEVGGSMVDIEESGDGSIYIEGWNVGKLQAYVEAYLPEGGMLYVKSVRPANLWDEIKNSHITLYLPEDCSLDLVDVSLGAGQLQMEDLTVESMMASIGAGQLLMEDMVIGNLDVSLGAGELRVDGMEVQSLMASIGAGNMDFSGAVNASAQISCSMGNVSMKLEGDKEDFDYQLDCVAGNMMIDGEVFAGAVVERTIDNGADKFMDIDCSMGNVEIDF